MSTCTPASCNVASVTKISASASKARMMRRCRGTAAYGLSVFALLLPGALRYEVFHQPSSRMRKSDVTPRDPPWAERDRTRSDDRAPRTDTPQPYCQAFRLSTAARSGVELAGLEPRPYGRTGLPIAH
jgi:hypothetical protein